MFIKNIIISGFRSYREQSFPDGLSAGTNTIVGKNGSGKSNFFAAIQFVLNEKFSTLRPAERKDLFHVGSGRPSLSIFVEIVFDNSDGRLVIPGKSDEPEVRIRRTVGLKQDEFRVNDRKFSAAEVHQLLESAGFSSSNPYYIVEQGKIASMASMNEQDRYQLIKDVAGTKVYEIRRLESERILGETKVKHSQIDESIAQLNEKLKDLETESAELKEFHEADQEKKCIEYCIFTSDLRSTKQSLEKLDTEWKGRLSTLNDANNSSFDEEHELAAVSGALADLTTSIGTLEAQKESIQRELSALYQKQAVTELDVTHAAGSISRNEMEHTSLVKEQKHLEKAIGASRQALSNAESALRTSETRAAEIASTTAQLTASLDKLQEKRNRTKLFKSKHERDAWISKEIDSNSEISEKASSEARTIDAERKHIQEAILLDEQKLHQMTSMTSKPEGALPLHESKISSCVSKRDSLNAERRRLWQAVHDQESLAQRLDDSASRAQQQLDRIVRQDIRIGLRSVREILQQRSDQLSNSVHGQLIELIKVEEGFESAADITAGNALFHVVVDSFDTSALLLNEMNRQKKPGRVSFFPLDTCKGTATRIPSTEECFPLVSKICCDQKFGGIISEVFGRTAVVTSMEAGARLVKELQCDVVTLDGDQLGRRGGITGGYIDRKNVKLSVHIREKKARAEAVAERAKLNLMYEQVATVEQQITQVLNELESLRSANESNEKEADSNLREIRAQEEYITRRKAQIESLDARKAHLLRAIDAANQQIGNMRKEKNEPFTVVWCAAEETNMEKLSEEVSQHRRRSAEAQAHTLQLATDLKLQEDALLHLERRHAAITDRIRELGWRTATSHSVNLDNEAIKKECSELSHRLKTAESKLESLLREKQKLELQAKTLNAGRLSSTIDNQERKEAIDTMQMQRNLLVQRRDEAQERLRKLGAVPTDINKYATFSLGKLMHNLKGVNDRLRKFMHVNRKALDQHASMLELKNDLQTQRESLNRELTSIHELMNHLDQKKCETIERTFKQIQYQFEEVFKELVGLEDCCAELQLLVRDEKTETDDPFWGTAIRVSFGLGTAVSDLDQLSGGQKSLVALALIFAIQRCDPAPFYLLDEIDAALDGEYRSAVAKVVQKQSRESQFIIASFKTEMLEVADKVFGIFFHNKVSRIQNISADEGTKLLKQAAVDDRKRSREGVA